MTPVTVPKQTGISPKSSDNVPPAWRVIPPPVPCTTSENDWGVIVSLAVSVKSEVPSGVTVAGSN